MLIPLLSIILSVASKDPPCLDVAEDCRDTVALTAIVGEIGNGAALTRPLAIRVRKAALRLAQHSTCLRVRNEAEELAFDMSEWIEQDHDDIASGR